ncbi:MAG: D-alanyl-D-alanine carboxypeptidase family protein [Vampirovibrionales bacterium]|nr:D-alanyl-D-alanine carboxypeptidase family protein [Vampirovibrionales bacterium]
MFAPPGAPVQQTMMPQNAFDTPLSFNWVFDPALFSSFLTGLLMPPQMPAGAVETTPQLSQLSQGVNNMPAPGVFGAPPQTSGAQPNSFDGLIAGLQADTTGLLTKMQQEQAQKQGLTNGQAVLGTQGAQAGQTNPAAASVSPSATNTAAPPAQESVPAGQIAASSRREFEPVKALQGQNKIAKHQAYHDAGAANVTTIDKAYAIDRGADVPEKLNANALKQFKAMSDAYEAQFGKKLQIFSGYRSFQDQEQTFYNDEKLPGIAAVKAKLDKGEALTEADKTLLAKRAETSAPPGFSEHATGLALDLMPAGMSNPDAQGAWAEGEGAKAYAWLKANAHKFGFEQSFKAGNQQGVSEERWHWRYVSTAGSEPGNVARQTFAVARNGTADPAAG